MLRFRSRILFLLSGIAALCFSPMQANAQMVLTANAIAAGFQLTTFASGFPSIGSVGPLGIAFNGSQVIVSDNPGNVRVFPTDTDGQSAGSVSVGHNYGYGYASGLTLANGRYYMSQYFGNLVQINANGTFNQTIMTGLSHLEGITTNPVNGHLFLSVDSGILDIDPIAKTSKVINGVRVDGLTTDGTVVYGAASDRILGFRISDGLQVFDSGHINGGPDGTALGNGTLTGDLFVNTNAGQLLEYNLTGTPVGTVLGTNGSRGDFVTVDPNGTLLLTQTDRILRLTAPTGGGFGNTPEPGPIAMLLAGGLTGAGFFIRRHQKRLS